MKITISKTQWQMIGKKAGWMKEAGLGDAMKGAWQGFKQGLKPQQQATPAQQQQATPAQQQQATPAQQQQATPAQQQQATDSESFTQQEMQQLNQLKSKFKYLNFDQYRVSFAIEGTIEGENFTYSPGDSDQHIRIGEIHIDSGLSQQGTRVFSYDVRMRSKVVANDWAESFAEVMAILNKYIPQILSDAKNFTNVKIIT